MPKVQLNDSTYELTESESILDGLLRNDVSIPHGCKAGACQSCLMQMTLGAVSPQAQKGLKPTQKQLNLFMACSQKAISDCEISMPGQQLQKMKLRVNDIEKLNPQVFRLRLEGPMDYQAGQYLNIWLDDTTIRSYSIASNPTNDPYIELHIRRYEGGRFSEKTLLHLSSGDELTIQGPLGECFYTVDDKLAPLLLAGIGTGLAPLIGIVKQALDSGHKGQISLYIGAKQSNQFYYQQHIQNLQNQYNNLTVSWQALDQGQDIYQQIRTDHPSTKDYHIYLCGAETFVKKLKKSTFLAGAAMANIHSDAFLPCS